MRVLRFLVLSVISSTANIAFGSGGTYTVPVAPEYEDHSRFRLADVQWRQEGATRTLSYSLPHDLTGTSAVAINLREVGATSLGFLEMSGDLARASCTVNVTKLVCLVRYVLQSYDFLSVETFLRQRYQDAPEIQRQKIAVARSFGNEPGGIVQINF